MRWRPGSEPEAWAATTALPTTASTTTAPSAARRRHRPRRGGSPKSASTCCWAEGDRGSSMVVISRSSVHRWERAGRRGSRGTRRTPRRSPWRCRWRPLSAGTGPPVRRSDGTGPRRPRCRAPRRADRRPQPSIAPRRGTAVGWPGDGRRSPCGGRSHGSAPDTETNMMFITPMPPTSREITAMPPSITVMVSSTELAAREDGLLRGDREVGVVGRGDPVQVHQQRVGLLVGGRQRGPSRWPSGRSSSTESRVGATDETLGVRGDRDDRRVVARGVLRGAERLQHADHLERRAVVGDRLTHGVRWSRRARWRCPGPGRRPRRPTPRRRR